MECQADGGGGATCKDFSVVLGHNYANPRSEERKKQSILIIIVLGPSFRIPLGNSAHRSDLQQKLLHAVTAKRHIYYSPSPENI